ncbi:MAG TPA: Na+/H+ antiporter subunit C [Dysgonamonadaceae bacterium]|jgi:multicomponent Na+:H+ antiporter subunit C|nr:Na+/H+ antiporter subunit C [Dysgonamonadaceae bacterium]
MDILLSIVVGLLYAAGFYMLLNKGMTKMIIGIMILGYASNLFIFIIARLTRGFPALIKSDNSVMLTEYADPIPQAFILTAIVIGFGIQAFAIVLLRQVYLKTGTDNIDELNLTDKLED